MSSVSAARPARRSAEEPRKTAAAHAHSSALQAAADLRELALPALARMYDPAQRLFYFTLRQRGNVVAAEGLSRRYTAITLIGLAADTVEASQVALHGQSLMDPCARLVTDLPQMDGIGDVALTLWALTATGAAGRTMAWKRLQELNPLTGEIPTVELAWTLSALVNANIPESAEMCQAVRSRLLTSFNPKAGIFPHVVGRRGVRSHVACFADQVYPIQALSFLARAAGDREALDAATACARRICELQGDAGQWWWHYDARTGDVLEGYPVYAVHQDSMAPMALLALTEGGGPSFAPAIERSFAWLASSPEIAGRSLVDRRAGLIWRKVARREPRRISRYAQASAAAIHPSLRVPVLKALFPPVTVDYEDRPYHLGWLLLTYRQLQEAVAR